MNYKKIILSIAILLTLPLAAKENIEKLKEERLEKMLEINETENKIAQCDDLLRNWRATFRSIFNQILERKKESLIQRNQGKAPEAEIVEKLREEIQNSIKSFAFKCDAFIEVCSELKTDLYDAFFERDQDSLPHEAFQSLRFILARLYTQTNLIKYLVEKYQSQLNDVNALNEKIRELEKENFYEIQ